MRYNELIVVVLNMFPVDIAGRGGGPFALIHNYAAVGDAELHILSFSWHTLRHPVKDFTMRDAHEDFPACAHALRC